MVGHPASHAGSRAAWYSGGVARRRETKATGLSPSGARHSNRFTLVSRRTRDRLEDSRNAASTRLRSGLQPYTDLTRLDSLRVARRYCGVRVCFSDPGTEMFQFPGYAWSVPVDGHRGRSAAGFPHSVTLGSLPATRLPEAFRGVPRPSSPFRTRGIPRVLCVSFSSEVVNVRKDPVLPNHIIMPPRLPRKEVIQPHLPIRLPCYDFTPIIRPTVDGVVPLRGSTDRLRVWPTLVV
jgi:hypothetical protein